MEVQMSNLKHFQLVIDPLNKLSEFLRDHEVKTEKSFDEPVDLDMAYGKYGDHTNDEGEEFKDAEIVPEEHIPVNYEDSIIIREIPRKSSLTGDHIGSHRISLSSDLSEFEYAAYYLVFSRFLASKSNGTMESRTSKFQSNGKGTSTSFTFADPIEIPKTGNTPDPTEGVCDEATHPQQKDETKERVSSTVVELRNYRLEIGDRFAKRQRDLQLRVVELEKLVTSNAGKNDINWLDTNDHLAQFETQIKYANDRISSYRDDMDENHEEINERIDRVQTRIDRIEWDLNIVCDKVTHEPENNERILEHVEDTNKNVGMIAEQM
ncbi:hypothetical protein QAD02_021311 [Eretmocerus hayati]|uniref:Uncharacterized protein n=1 Tax=Eretmocerus hayati TaxID=131215 RepID=A0ACC2PQX2_9HYME|nr:hypothetical protein QAD02_021311 [Eretmocerus hayati]